MDTYSHITNKMRIEMVDIMENFTNKKATGDNPVANPKEIQARLGNSRLATTMDTYAHVTKK